MTEHPIAYVRGQSAGPKHQHDNQLNIVSDECCQFVYVSVSIWQVVEATITTLPRFMFHFIQIHMHTYRFMYVYTCICFTIHIDDALFPT